MFLNKLKIVGNAHKKWKNQNKTSMTKAIGPFRDSQAPSQFSGPQTDVPAEPPLIGPDWTTGTCFQPLKLRPLNFYFC